MWKQNLNFVGIGAAVLQRKSFTEKVYRNETGTHTYGNIHVVLVVNLYFIKRGVSWEIYNRRLFFFKIILNPLYSTNPCCCCFSDATSRTLFYIQKLLKKHYHIYPLFKNHINIYHSPELVKLKKKRNHLPVPVKI